MLARELGAPVGAEGCGRGVDGIGPAGVSREDVVELAYGAGGFPYAVYLDGENRVLARSSGELGSGGIQQLWEATAASVG